MNLVVFWIAFCHVWTFIDIGNLFRTYDVFFYQILKLMIKLIYCNISTDSVSSALTIWWIPWCFFYLWSHPSPDVNVTSFPSSFLGKITDFSLISVIDRKNSYKVVPFRHTWHDRNLSTLFTCSDFGFCITFWFSNASSPLGVTQCDSSSIRFFLQPYIVVTPNS